MRGQSSSIPAAGAHSESAWYSACLGGPVLRVGLDGRIFGEIAQLLVVLREAAGDGQLLAARLRQPLRQPQAGGQVAQVERAG